MTKTCNPIEMCRSIIPPSAALAEPNLLDLIDKYNVSEGQRRIIIEASTKPLPHQQWFYDQFTRNR